MLRQLIVIVILLLLGIVGTVALDYRALAHARPPPERETINDFFQWKGSSLKNQGTVEISGVVYTVVTGPPGRFLASGPAVYLFDEHGVFIDWTSDMGDFRTVTHGFDLRGGFQSRDD